MDETVARAGMFHGVDSAVAAITKQLQPVDFARRQTVFAQEDPADRLYIIVSGKVKISYRSPEGRKHLLAVMGPPEMFGELSVFDDGPRTASAIALTELRAVSLDRDTLRGWMADRPEVAEQLLRVLARRLRRTNNKLTDLHRRPRTSRQATAAAGTTIRHPRRRRAASGPRPDASGDRSASRRVPGVNKPGAQNVRRPWLDPVGKPQHADPRRRKPCAPSTLAGPGRPPS